MFFSLFQNNWLKNFISIFYYIFSFMSITRIWSFVFMIFISKISDPSPNSIDCNWRQIYHTWYFSVIRHTFFVISCFFQQIIITIWNNVIQYLPTKIFTDKVSSFIFLFEYFITDSWSSGKRMKKIGFCCFIEYSASNNLLFLNLICHKHMVVSFFELFIPTLESSLIAMTQYLSKFLIHILNCWSICLF